MEKIKNYILEIKNKIDNNEISKKTLALLITNTNWSIKDGCCWDDKFYNWTSDELNAKFYMYLKEKQKYISDFRDIRFNLDDLSPEQFERLDSKILDLYYYIFDIFNKNQYLIDFYIETNLDFSDAEFEKFQNEKKQKEQKERKEKERKETEVFEQKIKFKNEQILPALKKYFKLLENEFLKFNLNNIINLINNSHLKVRFNHANDLMIWLKKTSQTNLLIEFPKNINFNSPKEQDFNRLISWMKLWFGNNSGFNLLEKDQEFLNNLYDIINKMENRV